MIKCLDVANTVLSKAFSENKDMTPMKLQKIIYFIYKKYLKDTGEPLFSERFEAWRYGPVLTSVYEEFKSYGSNHIKEYYISNDGHAWAVNTDSNEDFANAFDFVWDRYAEFDGIYLSSLTHEKETAWFHAIADESVFLEDKHIEAEDWF